MTPLIKAQRKLKIQNTFNVLTNHVDFYKINSYTRFQWKSEFQIYQ